ncbi:MAG TPA: hypothetical protein VMM17_08305 [Gemmatimonadaceae bacterium]|nr:hypothetical protein [Gemmatimonadaceae bacterium]
MRSFAAACGVLLALTACTERLDNDVGCPLLCPQGAVDIQTATVDAVVLDTTVSALLAPGADELMLLASRGDTLDTRVVIRIDSISPLYVPDTTGLDVTEVPIEEIHDAILRLRISTFEGLVPDPTTIEIYNVDSDTPDTVFNALLPLFTPERLLGGGTFTAEELVDADSVRVPLNGDALLPIIQSTERLRLGLRVSGPGSVQFHVFAAESGLPALLSFRPSADSGARRVFYAPHSRTPPAPAELQANLSDFVIFAVVPPVGTVPDLNVGGLPARRAYLRFVIPPFILDSSTVVRATLLLTQRPNPTFGPADTIGITVNLVLAGAAITDVARAATLTADPSITAIDTLYVVPAEGGERAVDIASFVRFWRGVAPDDTPHAVALASTRENGSALEARFFSLEADPALRPKLRISYSPRQPPGLP